MSSAVDVSQTFGEFLFVFNASMNYTGFVYSDFVVFNATNATLNMFNNFTVTFITVNATSFKLKLAPKPTIYFTGTTFCATTKA